MRLIAHDALTVSRRVFADLAKADALFRIGHDAQGRALVSELAAIAASELPVIDGVLKAQVQAAEGLDLTQWAPRGSIPLRLKAEKHPNACNDH